MYSFRFEVMVVIQTIKMCYKIPFIFLAQRYFVKVKTNALLVISKDEAESILYKLIVTTVH